MLSSASQYEVSLLDAVQQHEKSAAFWLPRILALAASFVGPLPLVVDLRFHIGMSVTAPFLWPLSVLLVIASLIFAVRAGDSYLLKTLLVALVVGYMATATYDSTRIAGISAGVTEMDEALDFGQRLTGQTPPGMGHGTAHKNEKQAPHGEKHTDKLASGEHGEKHGTGHTEGTASGQAATVAIGYAWHYWAGMMFSLGYLVLFGARRLWWAIPYMVFLVYPGMVFAMGSHSPSNFVWEAIGHAAFGLTLGIVSWALLVREKPVQQMGALP